MRDWLCVGRMEEIETRRLHGAEDRGRADNRPRATTTAGSTPSPCVQAPRGGGRQRLGQHAGVQLPLPRLALRPPGQADRRSLHEGSAGFPSREHAASRRCASTNGAAGCSSISMPTPCRSRSSPRNTKRSSPSFTTRRCGSRPSTSSASTATWKLFVENLQDFYHVQVLHRDTFGGHIDIDE